MRARGISYNSGPRRQNLLYGSYMVNETALINPWQRCHNNPMYIWLQDVHGDVEDEFHLIIYANIFGLKRLYENIYVQEVLAIRIGSCRQAYIRLTNTGVDFSPIPPIYI